MCVCVCVCVHACVCVCTVIVLNIFAPRHACAARATNLTYGASFFPENAVTYSAGNKGHKFGGDISEATVFKSYVVKL